MLSLLLLGCTTSDMDRQSHMMAVLTEANASYLERDPVRVADKFEVMADDPFDFMRGSAPWYWQDMAERQAMETHFLKVEGSTQVLLVGDLHPENVGTCLPGEEPWAEQRDSDAALTLEAVDLDGVGLGPWILDLRRAALGMALLVEPMQGCEDDCLVDMIGTFSLAYAEELNVRAQGNPGWDSILSAENGTVLADLMTKARMEGVEGQRIDDWTTGFSVHRRLKLDDDLNKHGQGMLALSTDEEKQLDRLLENYPKPKGFRVLDRARHYGTGVASLPAIRYTILWDLGEDSPDDDFLMEFREVRPPPALPHTSLQPLVAFEDLSTQIIQSAAILWSRPDADVRYTAVVDGDMTFKAFNVGSWFQHLDHTEMQEAWEEGQLTEKDLLKLSASLGRLLAAAHSRGQSGAVIAQDLGADTEILQLELETWAIADRDRSLDDYDLFVDAF